MLRTNLHRLRFALPAAGAAALVLVTTTALAGSGVGGVFNLGQVNTVDAQTVLTGNPGGNPLLKVTSTGTAAAVRGTAVNGIGTNGISTSGVGQQGLSSSGTGTLGTHSNTTGVSPGVEGDTNSTDAAGAGVVGKNLGGGPGLRAIVNAGAPPLSVNSSAKVLNLNADLLDGLDSTGLPYWKLGGNAGTTPGTNFLGTTDNQALELTVNGHRALRIEPDTISPDASSPNLIGGYAGNSVGADFFGAVIGGGGQRGYVNSVIGGFGTVGGGWQNTSGGSATVAGGQGNTASGNYSAVAGGFNITATGDYSAIGGGANNYASGVNSTVAGGVNNSATGTDSSVPGGSYNGAFGDESFAAGEAAYADASGSFVWADGTQVLHSNGPHTVSFGATGGARFVTAFVGGNPSSGVALASGGGSWASLSDRASKRNLAPIDRASVLAKLNLTPISSWNYRSQNPSIRHLGPMAQDFRAAFGLGEDSKHIDSIDSEGVALAAIQGLYRQNQALNGKVSGLERQNRALNARLTRLERAVATRNR